MAPTDTVAYNNLGSALHKTGDVSGGCSGNAHPRAYMRYSGAMKVYAAALKLQSNSSLLQFNMGNCYFELVICSLDLVLSFQNIHIFPSQIFLTVLPNGIFMPLLSKD